MTVLFWGFLIVLIVLAVRGYPSANTGRIEPSAPRREERQAPLEILQTRYAKGEISRDEYETTRHDLQGS